MYMDKLIKILRTEKNRPLPSICWGNLLSAVIAIGGWISLWVLVLTGIIKSEVLASILLCTTTIVPIPIIWGAIEIKSFASSVKKRKEAKNSRRYCKNFLEKLENSRRISVSANSERMRKFSEEFPQYNF